MTTRSRFALAALLAFAAAGETAAQTLTVNKDQQTLGGGTLSSNNASVGAAMNYIVRITSSAAATANPSVTVTDTLPSNFVLLNVQCAPTAQCPPLAPTSPTLNPPPLVISGIQVPSGTFAVTLTITGYFIAPGTHLNHVEALRSGDTQVEQTAKKDVSLTIQSKPLPVSVTLTKGATPTTGSTGTQSGPGTTYHYTVTVANNGAADVNLGGLALTDMIRLLSGTSVSFKFPILSFSCNDPACPTPPSTSPSGTVGFGSGTQAFQLPWGPGSVLKAGTSFVLKFDATFDANVNCGSGTSTIENDVFLSLGGSLTGITAAAPSITSSYSLPTACQSGTTLSLKKTQVSPTNPVAWGAPVTYTISFTNNTGAALTNLSVVDSLSPSNSAPAFTATVAAAPVCSPACIFVPTFSPVVQVTGFTKLFTAVFASIGQGQSVTITFQVTYTAPCASGTGAGAAIDNFAQSAPVPGATSVTTAMQPLPDCGLKVAKKLTTANPVTPWQPVEFQITYANPFPQAVTVRTLKDVVSLSSAAYGDLPIQIAASSCQATGSVTPLPQPVLVGSNMTVKFNNPAWSGLPLLDFAPVTFGPGASLTCTIRFVPQAPTLCQGQGNPRLLNTAIFDTGVVNTSSQQKPPVSAQATADLPLCRTITVDKRAPNPQSFTPGNTVTYSVLVTNNNPNDPVAGIHLDDPMPPGFTVVSASCPTPCSATFTNSLSSGDVQATIPSIPANSSVTVTITVKAPATGGSYDNVVTASFDPGGNFFAGPGNSLSSTANVQVLTPRLSKSFQPGTKPNQGTLTFTLANVGGNPFEQGITFTDTLPSGLLIVGTPSTTCKVGAVTAAGNAITFQGQMQAGEATCTVTVQVKGAGCNNRSNVSNTNNIDPSGASAMVNVTECPLSLSVDKTVLGAFPGFTGTFTFIVTCATPNGLIQQPLTITWPATTATLAGLSAGDTCTVAEDPNLPPLPAGHSWTGVPIVSPPGGVVVITTDGKNQVSFTNQMRTCDDNAHLTITKRVEGAPAGFTGTFNFNLACWSGTTLITKQVQLTVPGAASTTINGLPSGASCTLTEVQPLPSLPAGWFWESTAYLPSSAQVVLAGTCCAEIVAVDKMKFCCGDKGTVPTATQPAKPAARSMPRP